MDKLTQGAKYGLQKGNASAFSPAPQAVSYPKCGHKQAETGQHTGAQLWFKPVSLMYSVDSI